MFPGKLTAAYHSSDSEEEISTAISEVVYTY